MLPRAIGEDKQMPRERIQPQLLLHATEQPVETATQIHRLDGDKDAGRGTEVQHGARRERSNSATHAGEA